MENTIKQIINIENIVKERVSMAEKKKSKLKENCDLELEQTKKLRYTQIFGKIEKYKNDNKKDYDAKVKKIESEYKSSAAQLTKLYEDNFNKILNELYDRVIR
jgi:regulator of replication initiation timing